MPETTPGVLLCLASGSALEILSLFPVPVIFPTFGPVVPVLFIPLESVCVLRVSIAEGIY